jgi:hypothetical protein
MSPMLTGRKDKTFVYETSFHVRPCKGQRLSSVGF